MIPLTKPQREIIAEFYTINPTKVVFDKAVREKIWRASTKREQIDFALLERHCPALAHQIRRSYTSDNNIQSAVFSECVYAQTIANMFGLTHFVNCFETVNFIPQNVADLLQSYNLVARYVYSTKDKKRMLIEAGGCGGIDSVLITVFDLNIYTIEFKEPYAKTSEVDLPKYGEDGNSQITKDFLEKYPQFKMMLEEQTNLNFFVTMGHNVRNFSTESIHYAIDNNYASKKFADVICTEDVNGFLVMIPANQISLWAEIEGEIRSAGRNHSKVWTYFRLQSLIKEFCIDMEDGVATLKKSDLQSRKERGGDGKISGYKINPLFFVYTKDCIDNGDTITFNLSKVRQLKPTITAKMFFKTLDYVKVKNYYTD